MMCSGLISRPSSSRMLARSITLRNSRTLPGQVCCCRMDNAASDTTTPGQNRWAKLQASRGRSHSRSLQQGQFDRKDSEAIVKVFTERSFIHPFAQFDIGGGNDPDIDPKVVIAAQPVAPHLVPGSAAASTAVPAAFLRFHPGTESLPGQRESGPCATAQRR